MSDVFISYNSRDRPVVTQICRRLKERGLTPFLDTWDLIPGRRWQHGLLDALEKFSSAAICFGPNGLGDWQRQEMEIALNRHAREGDAFPVIPVLLPGVDPAAAPLGFLKLNTWVDLRGQTDAEVAALVAAVKGEKRTDRLAADVAAAINPYRGLAYFREDDAPLFFGREDFSAKVLQAVKTSRFVAIVGASGSGKSSIAHAGLLPKLRDPASNQVWAIHTMVPGIDPAERLAEVLTHALHPEPDFTAAKFDKELVENRSRIVIEAEAHKGALGRLVREVCRKRPGIERVLLLIDQFEEAFTLETPEKAAASARFIEELVLAAGNPEVPLTIVVTLRGDQYHQVTDRRALAELFERGQVNVAPMNDAELRQAIVAPLEKVGGRFQHGLVERIVGDVGAETNSLPLLEYALDSLWSHRDPVSGELTHVAYNEMDGLKGAIAKRANEIFGMLPDDQQKAAREILLRLVRPGAGTLDSKRPADLGLVGDATQGAIAALTQARLVIADQQKIEIVHEALIREWGLLRDWVDEARVDLALRDRLEADAARWAELAETDAAKADTLLLPPGLRLEEGRRLIEAEGAGLLDGFPAIRRYVERSVAYDAERVAAEQAHQDAELAKTRRQNRRLQMAVVAAGVMLLVAAGAGIGVWRAKQSLGLALADARAQRDEAEKEKREAEAQKQLAQRNFVAAKGAVKGLIFDVAQGLQNVAGMQKETIRTILETVRKTVDGLLATAPDDAELLRLKSVMLNNFTDTYLVAGDLKAALRTAKESLDIARKLAAQDQGNAQAQRDVSVSLEKIGDVKLQAGDQAGALAAYSQGLDIRKKLAAQDQGNAQAQADLARGLERIGDVKLQAGDQAGALAYSQDLDIAKKLAAQDQGNAQAQRDVSISLNRIGDVKLQVGDQAGALAAYSQDLDIARKLAAQDQGNAQAQRDVAISLTKIGDEKLQAGDQAGTLDAYQQSLDIARKLAAQDQGNAQAQRDVAISLTKMGLAKLKGADRDSALANFKEALSIAEKLAGLDAGNAQAADDLAWVRGQIDALTK